MSGGLKAPAGSASLVIPVPHTNSCKERHVHRFGRTPRTSPGQPDVPRGTGTSSSVIQNPSRIEGMATHFLPDANRGFEPIPANTPVTPVIDFLIEAKEAFQIDGDLYHVELVISSGKGRQADVLILRGHEFMRCKERKARRAMQIRYLEHLIERGRVDLPHGDSAKLWNPGVGLARNERTFDSLIFQSDAPMPS